MGRGITLFPYIFRNFLPIRQNFPSIDKRNVV
nr:MAG TPA: hypothetical protein [Bacteriophage sp.]